MLTTELRPDRSLGRALYWIIENIEQFDPFVDPDPNLIEGAQRASELSVSLYCCSKLGSEQMAGHGEHITAFLKRMIAKSEFSDRLLRSPGGLVLLLYMHAALKQQGEGDPDLQKLLQRLITAGYLEQDERPPHRQMDLRLALDWADLNSDLPSWESLCDASILSHPLRVPFVNVGAAYAYTHAFFFSFAFGTQLVPPGTWFDPNVERHTLTMLLITFCQERDWDLVGELLLCWESSGLEETSISQRAWEAFLDKQESAGAFSGPEKRGKAGNKSLDVERQYFARHYHTTLVAIMAMTCREAVQDRSPHGVSNQNGSDHTVAEPLPIRVDLSIAIELASGWLRELAGSLRCNVSQWRPDALCRLLVATWICDDFLDGADRLSDVKETISSALAAVDANDEQWSSVPSGLKLISAALLSSMGISILPLDTFFEQALLALADDRTLNPEADLPLSDKRTLFHQLGLLPEPPELGVENVVDFAHTVELDDLNGLQALAVRVDSCSGYGSRLVEMPSGSEWVAELLEGAALHCLRAYDLPRAARFIRALSRLDTYGQRAAASCCRYLLLHQQRAGQFGAFGPEKSDLARSLPEFSPELDLDLPVILECLWTLAETLGHPWSLYTALAKSRGARLPTEQASVPE